jgi:hypothetical protein
MLIIRDAQKVAFLEPFINWTLSYLRSSSAARVAAYDDQALRQLIVFTCERGLGGGMAETPMLLRLIDMVVGQGAGLLEEPPVKRLLSQRGRNPESRLDEIADYARRAEGSR